MLREKSTIQIYDILAIRGIKNCLTYVIIDVGGCMNLTISDKCVGCGACSAINPDIFEFYNNSVTVNQEFVDYHEDDCIDAVLNCPVNAISVDEYY